MRVCPNPADTALLHALPPSLYCVTAQTLKTFQFSPPPPLSKLMSHPRLSCHPTPRPLFSPNVPVSIAAWGRAAGGTISLTKIDRKFFSPSLSVRTGGQDKKLSSPFPFFPYFSARLLTLTPTAPLSFLPPSPPPRALSLA